MPTASWPTATENPSSDREVPRLRLLDAFRLEVAEGPLDLPLAAQRVVALLALRSNPVQRGQVAGTLWLDVPELRAAANLRTALWRLHSLGLLIVDASRSALCLDPHVWIDLHDRIDRARRWMADAMTDDDVAAGSAALEGELLPDWDDDWVAAERERYRQVRLHGLEAMADRMIARGRCGDALLAALAAVAADPLRESAHRALIAVHLAEGNVGEAVRQVWRCERLFSDELGVAPSSRLADLVAHLELRHDQRPTNGSRGSTALPMDASASPGPLADSEPSIPRPSPASALR
jgi:DNA-binding SARP family transcriptional activator